MKFNQYLFLIILTIFNLSNQEVIAEENNILTINCDAPKGIRFDAGPDILSNTKKHQIETSNDGISGMKPIFIIDKNKPAELLVYWGGPVLLHSKYPMKAQKATISTMNQFVITAIEIDKNNRNTHMYSFYPENGLGYFTLHRKDLTGGAVAYTFYSFCDFVE